MKNRWLILFAGIVIQTILGGIYAWSIFVPELVNNYGIGEGRCGVIFGLCIAVFTIVMILAGRFLAANGPRATALIGGVLYGLGYLTASLSNGNYLILLLGVSLLGGAGIGFGYVCPLTVGMQWFPKHKGLITGVAVAGFGGGAILLSSLATHFFESGMDVLTFFRWMAAVFGVLLILAALILDVPENAHAETAAAEPSGDIFSLAFLVCVFGIFMGTFAGLLVVGNLTPIVEYAGFSPEIAATCVSFFAVGNGAGRIAWGFFFDRIRYASIPLSLAFFAVVMPGLMMESSPVGIIVLASALLGFGFGANFVVYASALSNHFGVTAFPRLYPVCFLGYGLAGIIGPGVGGYLAEKTGGYGSALWLSFAMLAIAAILTGFGIKSLRHAPKN